MKVAVLTIAFILAIYTIIATSRSTNDRLIRKMGIVAMALAFILLILQIFNVVDELNESKNMQDKLQILMYKTINENEIKKKASEILKPSGEMMSWIYSVNIRENGEKINLLIRTLAIPKSDSRIADYVIIDSVMPGAPEFHPMVSGRQISSNDEYYIALVVVQSHEYLENPSLIVVTKYRNGEFDIIKYRMKDIAYDPKEFVPQYSRK